MDGTMRFPLFVNLTDKKVIVFGGGNIAFRRVSVLIDFCYKIFVVAPEFADGLIRLNEKAGNLSLVAETFDDWEKVNAEALSEFFLVLAATDNIEVNERIASSAREAGALVNVCDNASNCDFYFPAIVRTEDLVIGICGDGKRHNIVKDAAADLRNYFEEQ